MGQGSVAGKRRRELNFSALVGASPGGAELFGCPDNYRAEHRDKHPDDNLHGVVVIICGAVCEE